MLQVYKNDIGTQIKIETGQDLTTATVLQIFYKKPNGNTSFWSAQQVVGEPTKLYYNTIDGDLDMTGKWEVQVYVEFPSWKGYGAYDEFLVEDHIDIS